jgi:hypothetical protein
VSALESNARAASLVAPVQNNIEQDDIHDGLFTKNYLENELEYYCHLNY